MRAFTLAGSVLDSKHFDTDLDPDLDLQFDIEP
jgi:hypothetical protein